MYTVWKIIALLLFKPGAFSLQWSPVLQDGGQVTSCVGEDIRLPWLFALDRSEVALDVEWYFQRPGQREEIYATFVAGRLLSMGQSIDHLPNAGLLIHGATVAHTGTYSVHVNVHNTTGPVILHTRSADVTVAIAPNTSDDSLHLQLRPGATVDQRSGQWSVELECGHFTSLGSPPVNVDWMTASGHKHDSSSYGNGTFVLALTDPATSGNYSCQLSRDSPATTCVASGSPLLESPSMLIDGTVVKLTIMEAREHELNSRIQRLERDKEVLTNQTQSCRAEKDQLQLEIQRLSGQAAPGCPSGNPTTPAGPRPTLDTAHRPASCMDIRQYDSADGIHTLFPTNLSPPIAVYCDQTTDGGGWAVFQRRVDGSVDFYRNWTEYQRGFGDLNHEFWLGLESLHILTTAKRQELRLDLEDWEGNRAFAKYTGFSTGNSADNYRLHFDSFNGGDAGDSLARQNDQQFSTPGSDHDKSDGDCSNQFHGAWWFSNCHDSNLNGEYKPNSTASNEDGLLWVAFKGYFYSLKRAEMKMRPM